MTTKIKSSLLTGLFFCGLLAGLQAQSQIPKDSVTGNSASDGNNSSAVPKTKFNNGKLSIAIFPFDYYKYIGGASLINEAIVNVFNELNRFNVIDIRQTGSNKKYYENDIANEGKNRGADYAVNGSLTDIEFVSIPDYTSGLDRINASIIATVKIINIKSGQPSFNWNFNSSVLTNNVVVSGYNSTRDGAFLQSLAVFKKELKRKVSEAFPLTAKLLEVTEKDDKKGVRQVRIAGGSANGYFKSQDVKIVSKTTVELDVQTIEKSEAVAEGVIEQVEDANFSLVKVKKNGLVVLEKLNNGAKLFVVTEE